MRSLFSAVLISVLIFPAAAFGAQAVVSDDTYTESGSSSVNGNIDQLRLGDTGKFRTYLKFNLASLPAGTTAANVEKATLRLFVNSVSTAGAFNVHKVNAAWSESALHGTNQPDFEPLGFFTTDILVATSDVRDYLLLDITALVKGWVNLPASNHGIVLQRAGSSSIFIQFDSKETTATSHDPRLEIVLGSQGPQGATGSQGAEGPTGPEGAEGPTGPQGAEGPTGPQGAEGPTGPQGAEGSTGPQGAEGPTGPQGIQGPIGPPGISGLQYAFGPYVSVPNTSTKAGKATAVCPSGLKVIGGSGQIHPTSGATDRFEKINISSGIPVSSSTPGVPVTDGSANAWEITGAGSSTGSSYQFRALAICADIE
jgi:hypothetical protein